MNHGRWAESIFLDKKDYNTFLDLLIKSAEMISWYSSASSAIEGVKVQISKDRRLRKRVEKLG